MNADSTGRVFRRGAYNFDNNFGWGLLKMSASIAGFEGSTGTQWELSDDYVLSPTVISRSVAGQSSK